MYGPPTWLADGPICQLADIRYVVSASQPPLLPAVVELAFLAVAREAVSVSFVRIEVFR